MSLISQSNSGYARRWVAVRAPAMLAAFDAQSARSGEISGDLVFSESDNAGYAGAFLAAVSAGRSVWCHNPRWGEAARAEAEQLGDSHPARDAETGNHPAIFIPTGGTGGKIRFVRHDMATLAAAVSGFSTYAGERLLGIGRPARLHAVQALPCHHVSGLMPVVRAWLTGGELVFANPSFRPEDPLPAMPRTDDGLTVVSLVNAQLHRLLERPDGPGWLREAGLVLVGGSAVSPELLDRARREKLPLGVSYGLTEAAALVALHPPDAFLRGEQPVAGELLPHIRASITPEGRVALAGASLGADVPRDAEGRYITGDEGFLDERGRLVVTGRADRIIVSGGEKIDPADIEAAIRATGLVREVVVIGEPDPEWGRRLVAVYYGDAEPAALAAAIDSKLERHRMPKRWVRAAGPVFDEKGKFNRVHLQPPGSKSV